MTNVTWLGPRAEVTLLKEMQLIIWVSENIRKKVQGRRLKDTSIDFTRNNWKEVCKGQHLGIIISDFDIKCLVSENLDYICMKFSKEVGKLREELWANYLRIKLSPVGVRQLPAHQHWLPLYQYYKGWVTYIKCLVISKEVEKQDGRSCDPIIWELDFHPSVSDSYLPTTTDCPWIKAIHPYTHH